MPRVSYINSNPENKIPSIPSICNHRSLVNPDQVMFTDLENRDDDSFEGKKFIELKFSLGCMGLAVVLTLSTLTTSKNIDEIYLESVAVF